MSLDLLLLLSLPPSLLLLLYSFFPPSRTNKMDNNSNADSNCTDEINVETIVKGVMGGMGSVTCIVALVLVLVSRFYKDIVQRLILYKLITMFIYSLSQFLFLEFDESQNVYNAFTEVIPITAYSVNVMFTFWLTVILFICIVKLKEMNKLKKLEPVAIVTSLLSFVYFILVPFTHYEDCLWQIVFRKGGKNRVEYIIISFSIFGILNFIISLLVTIIFITAIKRSRMSGKRLKINKHESPLLTNSKWRALSKQLLPIVAYPIINTGVALIYFPLVLRHNDKPDEKSNKVFISLLVSSPGLITSITVILHLCILKYKKKQRERKGRQSLLDYAEELVHNTANENSAMFTSDTLASTNARTEYYYTRTSSFNENSY